MKYSFSIFFLLISFFSLGQQAKVDSLSKLFHEATIDTIKCDLLAKAGIAAYHTNRDLAKKINDSLINFSKDKSLRYLGQGYRMKGTLLMLDGNYNEASKEYTKAIDIFKKINRKLLLANIYSNLGTLYGRQKKLELSTKFYKKSIKITDSLNNIIHSLNPYINLGINYSQLYDYETSNKYLIKVLELTDLLDTKKKEKKMYQIYAYSNLGDNLSKLKNYKKAEEYYLKSLKISKQINQNYSLATVYKSLGYLYEMNYKNNIKALDFYEKSLKYRRLLGDKRGIASRLSDVASQKIILKKYRDARNNLNESLLIAENIKARDLKSTSLFLLACLSIEEGKISEANNYLNSNTELLKGKTKLNYKDYYLDIANSYKKKGLYKEAYNNIEIYTSLMDSLYQKNAVEKVSEIETKYQTEKKEKENLQLKAEKAEQSLLIEKEQQRKWLLALGLVATLLSAFLIWKRYRSEAKAKQVISQQKNEIEKQKNIVEVLQRELHHRIKNNLSYIDLFITLAKGRFTDKDYQTKLNELQNRMHSMFEVHKLLFKKDDITNVNAKSYVNTLLENVQKSYLKDTITIKNTIKNNEKLSADIAFPVGLIINEFVTNSYKYAFSDNEKGSIAVDLTLKNNFYNLSLKDNGKGLPENFDMQNLDSFGIEIIELLTKEYKGTFAINGKNGVSMDITLPKKVA